MLTNISESYKREDLMEKLCKLLVDVGKAYGENITKNHMILDARYVDIASDVIGGACLQISESF